MLACICVILSVNRVARKNSDKTRGEAWDRLNHPLKFYIHLPRSSMSTWLKIDKNSYNNTYKKL